MAEHNPDSNAIVWQFCFVNVGLKIVNIFHFANIFNIGEAAEQWYSSAILSQNQLPSAEMFPWYKQLNWLQSGTSRYFFQEVSL